MSYREMILVLKVKLAKTDKGQELINETIANTVGSVRNVHSVDYFKWKSGLVNKRPRFPLEGERKK